MTLAQAKKELLKNINMNFAHAVLLKTIINLKNEDGYYTEVHGGHAGNCCCNQHSDFVWREDSPYTDPQEVEEIEG